MPAGGVWHAGVLCEPDPCASSSAPGPIENLSHGEALDLAGDAQTPRLVILDPIAHGSSPRRIQAFLPAVRDGEESAPARPGDSRGVQAGSIPAVRLTIHDVMGRLVCCLADGPLPPGLHEWQWDGRNARGEAVRTGVYFCRLTASGRESIAELLVVR
ncbi:MAG: hypothetical protein KBD56_07855 [Candidatus Eisenbacteria bacterium]|nr:hypothetical protein [Candidatus Eisenbacteria bacterium]